MTGLSFARTAAAVCLIGLGLAAAASAAPFDLAAKERATLKSIAKAAPPGGKPVPLDLSNDDNYRAYKALLRAHGLTSENRPQLFSEIETVRERQVAKRKAAKPGVNALADEPMESNSMYEVIDIATNDWATMSSTALTSVPGGTLNSTVTIDLQDADGNFFAHGDGESYEGINYAVTTDTGTNPYPDHGEVTALSTFIVTYKDGTPGLYVSDAVASYYPQTITNTAPVITPTTPTNPYVLICLNRSNAGGGAPMPCNYGPYPDDVPIHLYLPTSGSFKYFGPIDVDGEGKPTGSFVSLTMVGQSTGTACEAASFNDFWKYATVNNDTLSWSIVTPPADFGPVCYQNNEFYTYTLTVRVYVNKAPILATITNAPGTPDTVSNLVLGQIQVQYGCIAEGTEVLMADGSRKKIEDVAIGDALMAPGNTIAKVDSRTVGWDTDFVSLTDAAGDNVVVTPAHPIILEGGPIKAEKIHVGDRIRRADGSWSPVVKATRDTTDKRKVYNLVLNPKTDIPPPVEKSEFFAGGVLVGDGDLQHSLMIQPKDPRTIAERLPKEWQVDYANYLKEHPAKGTMR